jgi:hypothetical protein
MNRIFLGHSVVAIFLREQVLQVATRTALGKVPRRGTATGAGEKCDRVRSQFGAG